MRDSCKVRRLMFAPLLPFITVVGCTTSELKSNDQVVAPDQAPHSAAPEAPPNTKNAPQPGFPDPQMTVVATNDLRAIKLGPGFDQTMVQVVRDGDATRKLKVPEIIVVHDRNSNVWRIAANPN